ncbi:MAG: hypothetical protein HY457_01750 [Parcubacteria group bacterium]|nr:hypothetical protein [Parcubacteria group bacterium]
MLALLAPRGFAHGPTTRGYWFVLGGLTVVFVNISILNLAPPTTTQVVALTILIIISLCCFAQAVWMINWPKRFADWIRANWRIGRPEVG